MLLNSKIEFLVIHCSDSEDTLSYNATDIHKLHLKFGWDGIGYHKVICRSGLIENGRPEFWIGAHLRGYNDKSLGVCLIGRKIYKKSIFFFKIGYQKLEKKYPNAKIVGHYEITNSSKTCPNFNVKKWCEEHEFNI